jgi:predicted nucleic acid-binding protein
MEKLKTFFRDRLKRHPRLERAVRLYVRRRRALTSGYPDWTRIQGQGPALSPTSVPKQHTKVLIATSVGSHLPGTSLESVLAAALSLRGAEPHVLLCDGLLPACLACDVTWYPNQEDFVRHGPARDLCKHCFDPAAAMYRSLDLPVHTYSKLVTEEERAEAARLVAEVPAGDIPHYTMEGLAVGEHALAGTLRFFARATLESEPRSEAVLRRYFHAALLTVMATRRLVRTHRFEVAVFHHGIYVPQGLIGEVCRQEGVRVVTWNPAYRKQCFIFSHGDTYHHTLMNEPTSTWEDLPWTPEVESELLQYLKSRWHGTQDWIWFHERPQVEVESISREVGLDFSRPTIGMLTNVMWDAQLHYPANAFPNMLEWTLQTIRYFAGRPDLQLLIRVHPAELRGTLPSRQPLVDEIRRAFPTLPRNVFVVPPESNVSTYAAMSQCDAVIIYGTKTGVELTSMGIPVIVAGEAWIRNKGVTMDATSATDYFRLLDQLPLGRMLEPGVVERARKYAYHFFFRRMIPLEFMKPKPDWPPFGVGLDTGLSGLLPGRSAGLDVVCDGILTGSSFVYPAEAKHGLGAQETAAAGNVLP